MKLDVWQIILIYVVYHRYPCKAWQGWHLRQIQILNLYLKNIVLMLVILTAEVNIKAAFVLLHFILYFRMNLIEFSKYGPVCAEN